MKRKFKNLAEAREYFENYDIENICTPSQFFIINNLTAEALNSNNLTPEDIRFWTELQFIAADQSGMIMEAAYSVEQFDFLAENLLARTGNLALVLEILTEIYSLRDLPETALIKLIANSVKHSGNKSCNKVFKKAVKELLKRNFQSLAYQHLVDIIYYSRWKLRTIDGKRLFNQAGEELLCRDMMDLTPDYLNTLQSATAVVSYYPLAEKLSKNAFSALFQKCKYIN